MGRLHASSGRDLSAAARRPDASRKLVPHPVRHVPRPRLSEALRRAAVLLVATVVVLWFAMALFALITFED